jgi:hypothetical protein
MKYLTLILLLPISTFAFTLITFDVDGTLVKGSGQAAAKSAHAKAFSKAVGQVLGSGPPVTPVADALPVRKSSKIVLPRVSRFSFLLPSCLHVLVLQICIMEVRMD